MDKDLFNLNEKEDQRDLSLLLGYVGWVFVTSFVHMFVSKFVIGRMLEQGASGAAIGNLWNIIIFTSSTIDILFPVLIIVLAKHRLVKRWFTIFLIARILIIWYSWS